MSDTITIHSHLLRRARRNALRVLVLGIALPGATAAMAGGPLDFLFNPANPPAVQTYVEPATSPAPLFGLSAAKPTQPRHLSHALARPSASPTPSSVADAATADNDGCCADVDPATGVLLRDSTLRPGDAVMTPTGIRVFEGRISPRHSSSDLVPLAGAKNILPSNRTALAAIDVPSNKTVPAIQAANQSQKTPSVTAKAKPILQKQTVKSRWAMASPE